MAQPERRRTSVFQKLQLSIELSTIFTVLGLVYWFGQQTTEWKKVAAQSEAHAATLEQVQTSTAQVSGQVLQMASSSSLSEATARISVLETRAGNTEQLVRDLRADVIARLNRIETKIDRQQKEGP